jgi:hypothetical protein
MVIRGVDLISDVLPFRRLGEQILRNISRDRT